MGFNYFVQNPNPIAKFWMIVDIRPIDYATEQFLWML